MTVAESLRRFRTEQKLSQKEVAEVLGIPATSYYRYESGRFLPQADAIVALAKKYGVSTDYLLGLSEEPRAKPIEARDEEFFRDMEEDLKKILSKVAKEAKQRGRVQDNESAERENIRRTDATDD